MMIKWLIFHFESGVCLLAELGTFSIPQCFFCLGRSKPPTHPSLQGSPHRKLGCVSPQPYQHALCLLDTKRNKLREGSRAKLWRYVSPSPPGSWILSPLVACVTSLPLLPRSPGEEFSIRLLLLLPYLHWKAKVPCSGSREKARLTFLTLQQMLTVCPAFHNANPDTSHSPSVRNTENVCQNSPAHAESEKSSYYCKLYMHYLSNELSAAGIQFILTLTLSCSFVSIGDERNHL